MNTYNEMYQYVKEQLVTPGKDVRATGTGRFTFRKRSEHIRRVWVWAGRLMEGRSDLNSEAVNIAAIFHDVGYALAIDKENHAENSAKVCRQYLSKRNFEAALIDFVTFLVANHSRKELLQQPETSPELVVLMEADLLDETGAMAILWDCMAEGAQPDQSYEKTYRHIVENAGKVMAENPMVTSAGKTFWENKQKLMGEFLPQLTFDLDIDEQKSEM